jgi:hypothetical protein
VTDPNSSSSGYQDKCELHTLTGRNSCPADEYPSGSYQDCLDNRTPVASVPSTCYRIGGTGNYATCITVTTGCTSRDYASQSACQADLPQNTTDTAKCGSKSGSYSASTDDFIGIWAKWCRNGDAINFDPGSSFPAKGQTITWECYVSTDDRVTCQASRDAGSYVENGCTSQTKSNVCVYDPSTTGVCTYKSPWLCVLPGSSCGSGKEYNQLGKCKSEDNQIGAKLVVHEGEKCVTEGVECSCRRTGNSNFKIQPDEYCPEVDAAQCVNVTSHQGKICNQDGTKCGSSGNCDQASSGKFFDNLISKVKDWLSLSMQKVSAQESEKSNEYIFDVGTGLLSNLTEGIYDFEYEGETYAFEIGPDQSEVMLFIDKNSNDEFDEGIDVKISDYASQVTVTAYSKVYEYELEEGLNFVNFPFIVEDEDRRTAASLLEILNEVNDDLIYSISKFVGGKWKMVGQNTELYDNDDFQLLPGQGYIIKAKEDVDISIPGRPIKFNSEADSAPIYLSQGWNLIGLYGTKVKSYTAKSLIQDINTDDFTADNVTKWVKDTQAYDGFQVTDGEEYGFDYPLNKLESYFVRIKEGQGNWQPSLGGNN